MLIEVALKFKDGRGDSSAFISRLFRATQQELSAPQNIQQLTIISMTLSVEHSSPALEPLMQFP